MDASNFEIVDFVLSKDTRETLLYVSIIGSYVFLMYGIFNGKPPLLMQRELDQKGRRYSLFLGGLCLVIFFLTMLVPILYDIFISKGMEVYIGNTPLSEGSKLIAVDSHNKRIKGLLTIKKKGRLSVDSILSLPTAEPNYTIYKGPVTFFGRKNSESYFEIASTNSDRVYVANENGKIRGPILAKDATGKVIARMLTNNWGGIIIPDNSRVEFYNAALLYREEGGNEERRFIGSRIDCKTYSYDGHYKVLSAYKVPTIIDAIMINDNLHDKPMASGTLYNKDESIASSSLFPIGTVLHVSNPLVEGTDCDITVKDKSPNILNLSGAAIEKLQFTKNSRAKVEIQVKDYIYKKPLPKDLTLKVD